MIKALSMIGTNHKHRKEDNQDALYYAQNEEFDVIALADGVSSCCEAKKGAEIASKAITNLLFNKGEYLLEFEKKQIAELVLSHVVCELNCYAEKSLNEVEDYSSTVAGVFVDKKGKRMLCFNLGDSIIMAVSNGKCRILAMPFDSLSGCCVTTTKNALSKVSVSIIDTTGFDSVIICSDGAWLQMFNKNKLKPEVYNLLADGDYDELEDYLTEQQCLDDYSFISLNLNHGNRRSSA